MPALGWSSAFSAQAPRASAVTARVAAKSRGVRLNMGSSCRSRSVVLRRQGLRVAPAHEAPFLESAFRDRSAGDLARPPT